MPNKTFVSGGRNPNSEKTCGFPECVHFLKGDGSGGWCGHTENRVGPSEYWPNGFTPSVCITGGCGNHEKQP